MKKWIVVVAVLVLGGMLASKVHAQSTAAILEDCGADGDNIVWGT